MQQHHEHQRGAQGKQTPHNTTTTVVIVGAGPTGLVAANLLGMAGIQTLLIERNTGLSDCPRAISIDDEGLRICQSMGLCDDLMRYMILDIEAQYISGHTLLATVAPTGRSNGYPHISTFHQPTFEAVLLNGIERFPCVSVLFQHTLTSFQQDHEGVSLLIHTPDESTMSVRCSYMLACDGGQSQIRHALSIPMYTPSLLPSWLSAVYPRDNRRGKKTIAALEQRWISLDCINSPGSNEATDPIRRDVGYFFCHYQRPAVTLPTPFNGRRWEFMLHPHEQPEEMLDDETLHSLMKQTLAYAPPDICPDYSQKPSIIRRTYYTFRTAIADSFQHGRVFLLGDAAHLMPPFAGQGMNSGLRDAHNLCWKLHLVLSGQAKPRLLDSYQLERAPHTKQAILLTTLPGRAVTTLSRPLAFLRDHILPLHNVIPMLRDAVRELRVKPAPRYPRGLSHAPLHRNDYKNFDGSLIPQPHVMTAGRQTLLLDDILGNSFALLKYCETPQEYETLQALTRKDIWKRLRVRAIGLHPLPDKAQAHQLRTDDKRILIIDESNRTKEAAASPFRLLKSNPHLCILLRPDRFILGLFDIQDAHKIALAVRQSLHIHE